MSGLQATYHRGTHRLVSPEETLRKIERHLARCGISRCADITWLDTLGVPTYSAIRPLGFVLQTSNGKGLTHASAKASALMEAIEFHHAENPPPGSLRRGALRELKLERRMALPPDLFDGWTGGFFSDDYLCEWTEGEHLADGSSVWVPSSTVYFDRTPSFHNATTNGLASGNHRVEASLHALYELIERDAISKLSVNGRMLVREKCRVVDPSSVDDPNLRGLLDQIQSARTKALLLWTESAVAVHTFWAVLLNQSAFTSVSTLNVGWGAHLDPAVAAARALTEAAQSRATFIQGAREDMIEKPVYEAEQVEKSPAYRFFDSLENNAAWSEITALPCIPGGDMESILEALVASLIRAGHPNIWRFDLTQPEIGIPVVKIIVPTLRFYRKIF
jgi:ribosomal protein S12 methylthiotransferase accessory factor